MTDKPKKLRFEDLQPHVEMLIDALENKGASSSGFSYEKEVYDYPQKYRGLLEQIRNKNITIETLVCDLKFLRESVLQSAKNNQFLRIQKIVFALDIFIMKEYNKMTSL